MPIKSSYLSKVARGFAAAVVMLFTTQALAFNVTSSITGWWEQPDQQSHGLIISTSQLPDGTQRGVVFWAHYDSEGNATWLLGEGPLDGSAINADLYEVGGVSFMQAAGTVPTPEQKVGELVITFSDCNTGEATYSTDTIGDGSFRVSRLTRLAGLACSGGVTDDIPPTIEAQKIEMDLTPATGFAGADADAEWLLSPGLAKFEVDIENVPVGEYTLVVGGVVRGAFDVQVEDAGEAAEGYIEFFSPKRGYHPLLDFDPRGEPVQITSGGVIVASGVFPIESTIIGLQPDDDDDGNDDGNDDSGNDEDNGDTGETVLRQRMTNAGVFPQGQAKLEFESEGNEQELELEVEDIPAGDYSVMVNTVSKGTITVVERGDGDLEGDLEFRSPARAGYALLDFDPRGALIEVLDGSTTLFFTTFQGDDGNGSGDDDGTGGGGDTGPGDDDDDDDGGPGGDDGGPGDDDDDGGPGDDDGGPGDDDGDNDGAKQIVRFRLDNLTDNTQASAMTKLETDNESVEFEVEIDQVSPGAYTLQVGGIVRGSIVVEQDDNDGDIEFSDPQEEGTELLDFEVKGQTIEILDGETVIFSGTFPNA